MKFQNNTNTKSAVFFKGMNKDISPEFLGEGEYLHAINVVNNSDSGDRLKKGNEQSNVKCASFTYPFNGSISLGNERFIIFSTNDTDSEIGLFESRLCSYKILINDSGRINKLGFKRSHVIKGVAKENWDCTESIYWNNGLNPARTLNLSRIPYVIKRTPDPLGGCDIEKVTDEIDVEALRMTPLLSIPSLSLKKGDGGGNLPNGVYRIAIAYAEDSYKISDYLKISDPIILFNQNIPDGSLELSVTGADKDFKNYELVLISTVNQQTTARLIGRYPVEQKIVYIDTIKQDDGVVDLGEISLQSVHYEGGDTMFKAGDHLIQTAPRTRPDFNYQPQASKIRTKWVSYAVPEDYYRKDGTKIGYTKGEVIALFIRFVYNTGHRTPSYVIMGREAINDEKTRINNTDSKNYGEGQDVEKWEIYDTSTITKVYPKLFTQEYPVAEGGMGYYETAEIYPDNPEVWGSNACKPVRHGRFPDNCTVPNFDSTSNKIIILGIKLENITYPLDNKNKPIEGIVGYEILRGDKEGNKSIVAKGLIFNTGEYELPISYNGNKKALYPNYPFNDLNIDPYLSKKLTKGGCGEKEYTKMGTFNKSHFTFHSPETHFHNPALSSFMKVEAEYYGKSQGYFEQVYNHPKHKLIRDFALLLAGAIGIGEGLLAIKGRKTTEYKSPEAENKGEVVTGGVGAQVAGAAVATGWQKGMDVINQTLSNTPVGSVITDVTKPLFQLLGIGLGAVPGVKGGSYTETTTSTAYSNVPGFIRIGTNTIIFSYFFAQGTEGVINVIRTLVPYRQHAYQCNMSGLYDRQSCPTLNNIIRKIEDYSYLYPGIQDFQGYRINNNLRESSLILKLKSPLEDTKVKDNSRQTIGTLKQWDNPDKPFETDIAAHYVSIKRKLKNLYGQIENIRIVPTTSDIFPIEKEGRFETPVIFGGDTIIEEFTLKRKNNLFTQTQADGILGTPNGYEFDYRLYPNILYPRYWMDTQTYDLTQLFNLSQIKLPNDFFNLDRKPSECRRRVGFSVKDGYMYTSVNGIVRFYVESSYHIPSRKNSDVLEKKHFDRKQNTDLSELFRGDIIKKDNYFEIDKSLSPIKQLNFTHSQLLPDDFSVKNNNCFTYEQNKLLYSLPSFQEDRRDNWRAFLTNNYFTFPREHGRLVSIRDVNRTGVLYFFSSSPLRIHPGVDELQTEGGIKVTIGDGGLFARIPQAVTNTDNDFTECQSSEGIASTPYGIFFMSQRQGKIFKFTDGAKDISSPLKWWLAEYMPSTLLKQFPSFELTDNTSIGIGCIVTYDNTNEIVYFSKRDYSLKKEFIGSVTYSSRNEFKVNGSTTIYLGDPSYFNDSSWTLSYDPKGEGEYISYHSWNPDGALSTSKHFITIKEGSAWIHNETLKSFCNFYGVDYPWEIEYPTTIIQDVTTQESIEYQLQAYNYSNKDRFHILNENFDRAVLWNTEQCSGLLKMNMRVPNNPQLILNYPQYTPGGVNIEVTKTENKYRFNQFSDITKNRGQFSLNWRTIWKTDDNGYTRVLNSNNIDYNKLPGERKKFRHFSNIIYLRKNISGNVKFLLTLVNNKVLKSFR